MFLGVLLAATIAGGVPQTRERRHRSTRHRARRATVRATPMSPPRPRAIPDTPGAVWLICRLPDHDAVVDWPSMSTEVWPAPRSFILSGPGQFATWLGEQRTEIGRPLIWYDGRRRPPDRATQRWLRVPALRRLQVGVPRLLRHRADQAERHDVRHRAAREDQLQAHLRRQRRDEHHVWLRRVCVLRGRLHAALDRPVRLRLPGRRHVRPGDTRRPHGAGDVRSRPAHRSASRSRTTSGAPPSSRSSSRSRTSGRPILIVTVVTDTKLGNINSGVAFPKTKIKLTASKKIKVVLPPQQGPLRQDHGAHQGRPHQGAPAEGQAVRRVRLGHDHQDDEDSAPACRQERQAHPQVASQAPGHRHLHRGH